MMATIPVHGIAPLVMALTSSSIPTSRTWECMIAQVPIIHRAHGLRVGHFRVTTQLMQQSDTVAGHTRLMKALFSIQQLQLCFAKLGTLVHHRVPNMKFGSETKLMSSTALHMTATWVAQTMPFAMVMRSGIVLSKRGQCGAWTIKNSHKKLQSL